MSGALITRRARALALALALLALAAPSFTRPQGAGLAQRIEFKRGSRTAVVKGLLKRHTEAVYLLPAKKGHRFRLHLKRDSRDCWFDLKDPDGEGVPEEEFDANLDLSGRFRKTGDYRVTVAALSQDARYTLTVTVR